MFGFIDKLRRSRRRRNMRMRPGRRTQRRASRFRLMNWGPVLTIGGIALGVVALVLLIIFVIVPLFGGGKPEPTATPTPSPTPSATPIARSDMSDLDEELAIDHQSINDPYVFGREVIFSTGAKDQVSPEIKQLAIYNLDEKVTTVIDGITASYSMLFEPKMNDKYIVYLDCKNEYGGAVCGFDRATGEKFVMREYLYGKPKVYLSGEFALWLQQTGKQTDRLYLYHLPSRETTEIEIFVKTRFLISAYMSDDAIIYVQPKGEDKLLENSYDTDQAEICVIPLKQGGDTQRIIFEPGGTVHNPMIQGDYIVYANGFGNEATNLMLCTRTGDTFSAPTLLAEGIVNYSLGDGYVAYTKDEAVYIYYFKDSSTGRLSLESTRSLLAEANGKSVIWYDITGLGGANVVLHAQVP